MRKRKGDILTVCASDQELYLRLRTDTHTEIRLDMSVFLENGRKVFNFDPAALLGGVETDGMDIVFRLDKIQVTLSYADLTALAFGDPVAVSERVFAMAPGADIYQTDLDLAARSGPLPCSPAEMTAVSSAYVDGNTLIFGMANAASPMIRLDMAAYLKRAKALCPFDPRLLLQDVVRGDMRIWLRVEGDVMGELYWVDLRTLTFYGESASMADKTLERVKINWEGVHE